MNGKDIKFAKEFSFTLKLEELPEGFKVNQELRYRVLGDSIILELEKTAVPAEIVEPVKDVQNNLAVYSGRSILRLDLINKEKRTLVVTLLCFYQQIDFENFVIVVDQAIHSELRKRKIEVDGAVSWIKKQIIFADHYVFALGENKKKSELLLLGKDIEILVAETPQGYLHIVEIRNNRGNFNEGIISLITGNISIEDRITEKAAITAEFKDRYNKLIRDNAELINLWRIYDSLEMEAIKQDALSMGYAKYRSYKRNGDQLCFSLDGCYVEPDFLRSDMYYVAIPVAEFNQEAPLDYDPRKAAITGTEYDPTCIHTAEFRILEDARDDFRKIPAQGYLLPSISGSVIQSKRRKIALENILSGKNQLSGLNVLLQFGEVVGVVESHRSAITGSLERYIFEGKKGRHFLDRQKKAIDVAINTPDIALIQGPPGTGKTLVIRSIVQRINELENGQAKILVTSTQHDAVDNAIKNMTYGGVPVNRAISKLRNKSGNLPIYQWIDGMIESCDSWLTAHAEKDTDPFSQLNQILDGLDVADTQTLHDRLGHLHEELLKGGFSAGILSRVQALAGRCISAPTQKNANETLLALLAVQQTEPNAFVTEGRDAVLALERYLKYEAEGIDFVIPEYWKKLRRISVVNDELSMYLEKFKADLQALAGFCEQLGAPSVSDEISLELAALIGDIEMECTRLNQATTPDSELYELIWTFKHELSSTVNVKEIISAYSQVNAATCQQAANRNINPTMNGFNDVYDYVIIDEAARSNPLDLLIPMSMGKRIILVGDHKQLPHLVERDIVERVVEKTKDNSAIAVLKESLFMRLFYKVREADATAGTQRTCVLNEQFRMHSSICNLINTFYQEEHLKTACADEDKLHALGLYDNKPLAWIDLPAGDQFPYEKPDRSKSRPDEVKAVIDELKKILPRNRDYEIGVTTFYAKQAALIRTAVDDEFPDESFRIEIGTVDAFQGKEFDVMILSTVRSNGERQVGFLDDDNRLCVAFSRAKRLLIAIGDAQTVAVVEALNELLKKCKDGEDGYYECKTV